MAIYRSIGLWYGKNRPWLARLMGAMVLLTAFSRNYLGVHTFQDVAGQHPAVRGVSVAERPSHGAGGAAARPGRGGGPAGGMAAAVLAVVWFSCKSYPMDYLDGVLLVDPLAMMEDGFMAAGMVFGFYPGWLIERRRLRFSTREHRPWQFALAGRGADPHAGAVSAFAPRPGAGLRRSVGPSFSAARCWLSTSWPGSPPSSAASSAAHAGPADFAPSGAFFRIRVL